LRRLPVHETEGAVGTSKRQPSRSWEHRQKKAHFSDELTGDPVLQNYAG
jgi:hypothetical protein